MCGDEGGGSSQKLISMTTQKEKGQIDAVPAGTTDVHYICDIILMAC